MPDHSDIVIVGAGAAGIAAARFLMAAGKHVHVLEARNRPGGRAYTRSMAGWPLDMGCGWLHSANNNPLGPLARDAGFQIDETLPPWQQAPDLSLFSCTDRASFLAVQEEFEHRLLEAAKGPLDLAAAAFLPENSPWEPRLNAISTYVNGVELDQISVRDVTRYRDSEVNHRIVEGLGQFIGTMAGQLPISYSCPVLTIDHSTTPIRVETRDGSVTCGQVIVTVPTNVLAAGAIRMMPELPDHFHAAANLPLGVANKVFLQIHGAHGQLPAGFLIADPSTQATGNYHFQPFGWPLIEGYFGGAFARELELAGEGALAAQAIDELCAVLGNDWRRKVSFMTASAWVSDPFANGSYSHALPGHADKRAELAQPYEGRIFFAGEAVSPRYFSTVHGAWESGESAAAALLNAA